MNEQQKVDALMGQAPDMMTQSVALAVLRQFDGDVRQAASTLREMTMEYPELAQSVAMSDQSAVAEQEELLRRFNEEKEQRRREEAAERARIERERANAEEQQRIMMIRQAEAQQAARLAMLEKKREEMERRQREMEAAEAAMMQALREKKEQERLAQEAAQNAAVPAKAEPSTAIAELTASIHANRKAQTEAVIRQEVEQQLRAEAEAERESLRKALAELESHRATAMAMAEAAEMRSKAQAEELQKLERQFEERFGERMNELRQAMEKQVAENAMAAATPRATICWSSAEGDRERQEAEVGEVVDALTAAGLARTEIRKVDVVHDPELAVFVREQLKTLALPSAYPVVSVMGRTVGGRAELSAAIADGSFASMLDGTAAEQVTPGDASELADGTGEIVGEGVLDKCLNAAEYVASGIGSLLYLPVNIITYPFRGGSGELPKGPNDVDFDVLHTNWYWRNLRRKFRFYDAEFVRIHPVHKDIRGRHAYTSIESVVFNSDTNIVLRYNDGTSPDFIQASESDCKAIIRTIESKMGKKLTVWRAEDLSSL